MFAIPRRFARSLTRSLTVVITTLALLASPAVVPIATSGQASSNQASSNESKSASSFSRIAHAIADWFEISPHSATAGVSSPAISSPSVSGPVVSTYSAAVTATPSYPSVIATDNPSLYYRLGDATGSSAADSSGHNVSATYGTGVTSTPGAIAGDSNTAAKLTTTGQIGQVLDAPADSLPTGQSPRSFEVWVNTTSPETVDLIGYDNFKLQFIPLGLALRLIKTGGWDEVAGTANLGYNVADGRWHLLSLTYDGTTAIFYLDGVAIGSGGQAFPTSPVGKRFFAKSSGALDEVAIYPSVLSPARISAHFTRGQSSTADCVTAPSPTPSSAYSAAIVSDNPTAYYRANEATGSRVAYDSSGNCNNGSIGPSSSSVTGTLIGDPDKALANSNPANSNPANSTNPVTLPALQASAAGLASAQQPRTLETWFRAPVGTLDATIIGYGNVKVIAGANGNSISLIKTGSWDENVVSYATDDNSLVLDGRWHHLAATYDGTTSVLYLDGASVVAGGQLFDTTTAGAHLFAGVGVDVDEVAFYSSALSALKIGKHFSIAMSTTPCVATSASPYATTIRADHPAAYYRLSDVGERVAHDESGNCANAAVGPAVAGVTSGAIIGEANSAAHFGANQRGIHASASGLSSGQNPKTIEAWFRATVSGQSVTVAGYDNLKIVAGANGNNLSLIKTGSWDEVVISYTNDRAISVMDGNWHHVVATYDGSVSGIYLDGLRVGSGGTTFDTHTTGAQLFAGSSGDLDEVAFYNTALSPERINEHWRQSGRGFNQGTYTGGPIGGPRTALESAGGCSCGTPHNSDRGSAADPVDTASGNFYETVTDLAIDGRGIALVLSRTYNSVEAFSDSAFGFGMVESIWCKSAHQSN